MKKKMFLGLCSIALISLSVQNEVFAENSGIADGSEYQVPTEQSLTSEEPPLIEGQNGINMEEGKKEAREIEGKRLRDIFDYYIALEVATQLNKTVSDQVTVEELLSIKSIKISLYPKELSLRGVNNLQNLEELNLQDKALKQNQLSYLDGLTNLKKLNLSNSSITDINPLGSLTSLEELHLSGNKEITDISALSTLSNMKKISLFRTGVTNIDALIHMPSLTRIWMDGNTDDIDALSSLPQLEELQIGLSTKVDEKLQVIGGLTSLKRLDLSNSLISDVTPLLNLKELDELNLTENPIADASLLSGMSNLKYLNIIGTGTSDISFLGNLINLNSLYLNANGISDISILSQLVNLETLQLFNNKVSDVTPLSTLTNLKTLGLEKNDVSDISMLSGLTNIEQLWVGYNHITDVSVLDQFDKLISRTISGQTLNLPEQTATNGEVSFDLPNLVGENNEIVNYRSFSHDGWIQDNRAQWTNLDSSVTELTVNFGTAGKLSGTITIPVNHMESTIRTETYFINKDHYVIGGIIDNPDIKLVKLFVNDEEVSSTRPLRDGTFELPTNNKINSLEDDVKVVGYDRSGNVVDNIDVALAEGEILLTASDFTVYESTSITGTVDLIIDEVGLEINGVEQSKVSPRLGNYQFEIGSNDIYDEEDEVYVVGYENGVEVKRVKVAVSMPVIDATINEFTVGEDSNVTGTVSSNVKKVRIFINRRGYTIRDVEADGTFSVSGSAIRATTDIVEIAFMNESGEIIEKQPVTLK